jgi:hypothetical protein
MDICLKQSTRLENGERGFRFTPPYHFFFPPTANDSFAVTA